MITAVLKLFKSSFNIILSLVFSICIFIMNSNEAVKPDNFAEPISTQSFALTDELFSREIVDRLKAGYDFLIPYYRYFVTLEGDPVPEKMQ